MGVGTFDPLKVAPSCRKKSRILLRIIYRIRVSEMCTGINGNLISRDAIIRIQGILLDINCAVYPSVRELHNMQVCLSYLLYFVRSEGVYLCKLIFFDVIYIKGT